MNKYLPEYLYTADQVRQLDQQAIQKEGIPGFELMFKAAQAVFLAIIQHWPEARSVIVLCGSGNNGGDGYLVAKMAKENGLETSVLTFQNPEKLKGDAYKAWKVCSDTDVMIQPYDSDQSLCADIVVDAMLGTGLSGSIHGYYEEAVQRLNQLKTKVCAVDIPSGLCANTGNRLGEAVKANLTVTFVGLKQGLLTGYGPEYCGKLIFDNLGIPESVYQSVHSHCRRIIQRQFDGCIPPRNRIAHKGDFGHILLIGGNKGMPGAIIMAADAAINCGVGRATVVTRKRHLAALVVRCPEVMALSIKSGSGLSSIDVSKKVIVIGPGLGKDKWGLKLLHDALSTECSVVLDADAINLLSDHSYLLEGRKYPMILTPHAGELARLSGLDVFKIRQDRFSAVQYTYKKLTTFIGMSRRDTKPPIVLVLKGSGTIIYNGQKTSLCSEGNPGMAVGGMGDVLSGVIGALLALGIEPFKATEMAVWLHASAADDLVIDQGEIGLRATELIPVIRRRLNSLIR